MLESVPVIQVAAVWQLRFGTACFVSGESAVTVGAATVEVLGDFDIPGYALRIKLDSAISRSLPGLQSERTSTKLAQLHDPWANVRSGRHRLAVYAARLTDGQIPIDGSGAPAVAFCDFRADASGVLAAVEETTGMALLGPEGTLNGEAARPLVQAYWAPSSPELTKPSVELVIEHSSGQREVERLDAGAYRLLPTPGATRLSGDYALSTSVESRVTLQAQPGAPQASPQVDERNVHIVTINPE